MSLAPSVGRSPVSPRTYLPALTFPAAVPWGAGLMLRGGNLSQLERDVDIVVIGMGPGGEHAAGTLAEAGLAVAGVESRLVGGECPYWGCVPSKMMIRAADLVTEGRRIPGMAGRSEIAPGWAP